MVVTYFGLSCFKIVSKAPNGTDRIIITDPFEAKKTGLKLSPQKADVVITSDEGPLHGNSGATKPNGDQETFVVKTPGEYEVRDLYFHALMSSSGASLVTYIELEKMKLVFLGPLSDASLTDQHKEVFEGVDVLFVPVGGGSVLTAKQAASVARDLEPRFIIPMYFPVKGLKVKGLKDTPSDLFKELGLKNFDQLDKLKLQEKDLPQEETQAVELSI